MKSYMPHGPCFLWQQDLLALHVISDGIVALSYFSIPLAIFYYLYRKKIENRLIPSLFIAFIVSCGVTHLFTIWNFWHSDYWLSGVFKAACAGISAFTALFLWVLMPKILKMPTKKDIESLNNQLREANEDLELKVRNRTQQLEQANKELFQINTIVSHDLKNSLNAILGYAELVKASSKSPETTKFMTAIQRSGGQLNQFIEDLSSLVNLGKGGVEVHPVNLKEVVANVKSDFSMQLDQVGGVFHHGELGSVEGVQSLLHQLFSNLMSNSIKYRSMDRRLKINVYSLDEGRFVSIYWEDNGSGIDPQDRDHIFKMYNRGGRDKDSVGGSGVGLAFCRRIASIHGGEIFVDSSQSIGGTVFVVRLPKVAHINSFYSFLRP